MALSCPKNTQTTFSFSTATTKEAPAADVLQLPLRPARIYREAAPMLKAFAKRLGVPACDVDDVVQDAFLRLLEAGSFASIEAARCYLCSAVRCLVIDRYRRASFRKTECAGEDLSTLATSDRMLWESDQEHERALAALGQVLDAMAQGNANAGARDLAWFYRDGLSLKEICLRTKEPIGTVSARLARSRTRYAGQLRAAVEAAI